jgi:hypothetical protein
LTGRKQKRIEARGLMTEQEVDEVYIATAWQHAKIIGAERDNSTTSESILLPFVGRAFLEFFKQRSRVN